MAGVSRLSGFIRAERSPFIGRSADLARIDTPVFTSRLVTIAGGAGIGKTRLVLRYATLRKAHFSGVWFCDMRDARSASEMAYAVLRAFGHGHAPPATDPDAALVRALVARADALIILDNLEHLLPDGATIVKGWLATARHVRFLVTSRTPLQIAGEQVVELSGVRERDAVDLFIDRVRARMPFQPTEDDIGRIAELARRLECVPLAIELAAARMGDRDARGLLDEVAHPDTTPTAAAFSLLQPEERQVLACCSLFRGCFSLQAVSAVAGDAAGTSVVDLAAKNLLQVERYQPMRLSMCEAMRMVAGATLSPTEAADASLRHARYFADRARHIADAEHVPEDAIDDWEDLHAAAAFAAAEHPTLVLQLALGVDVLARGSGMGLAMLGHLDDALRRGAAYDLGLLGRALHVRSCALYALGRLVEARRDAETALSLAQEQHDAKREGATRRAAALAAFQLGELEAARDHLEQALAVERRRGDPVAIAAVHYQLGSLRNSLGETEPARSSLERALKLAQGAGDGATEARAWMGLGWNRFESGEREPARACYARALGIVQRMKMERSERIVLGYTGLLCFEAGELDEALSLLDRAALASRAAGDLQVEGIFEGIRGAVLASKDRTEEARSAFDLAQDLLSRNPFYQRAIGVHRGHLDLAEARVALVQGHHRAVDAHVARARWRIEEASAVARRSDDARAAILILERAISRF